jgi:hypothetical protein
MCIKFITFSHLDKSWLDGMFPCSVGPLFSNRDAKFGFAVHGKPGCGFQLKLSVEKSLAGAGHKTTATLLPKDDAATENLVFCIRVAALFRDLVLARADGNLLARLCPVDVLVVAD